MFTFSKRGDSCQILARGTLPLIYLYNPVLGYHNKLNWILIINCATK